MILACTQNSDKFWTRHLRWGLLQMSQHRALPCPLCSCLLAHRGQTAVTHSGPLPWLHSDWKLQWGHTHMSLLLGRRQTRTCSNPWKETQNYQYNSSHHFFRNWSQHQCCSAAQGPGAVSVKTRLVTPPTQGRFWQTHQALPEGLEGGVE